MSQRRDVQPRQQLSFYFASFAKDIAQQGFHVRVKYLYQGRGQSIYINQVELINHFPIFSAILFLFFNQKIGYDVNESTAAYHSFECLLWVFPVIGAIIADSWLGRYRTMVYLSVVVAIGSFIIAVGVTDTFNLPIR